MARTGLPYPDASTLLGGAGDDRLLGTRTGQTVLIGSASSQQAIMAQDRFDCTGPAGRFDLPSADGRRISHQVACPACFTRVYNTNSARPGLAAIRAGTFDDSHRLVVVAHIWTKRKQPWLTLDPQGSRLAGGAPDAKAFFRLIGAPSPAAA